MTVEPDMERMLASIRQAIDSDLNGLNKPAVGKINRQAFTVKAEKARAIPAQSAPSPHALNEIEELRNKIGRSRLVDESVVAANSLGGLRDTPSSMGFADILGRRQQVTPGHDTSAVKRQYFSFSDSVKTAPAKLDEPVLRPALHDFTSALPLNSARFGENSYSHENKLTDPSPSAYRASAFDTYHSSSFHDENSQPLSYSERAYEFGHHETDQDGLNYHDEYEAEETEWDIPELAAQASAKLPALTSAERPKTFTTETEPIISEQASAASAAAFSQLADTLMARAMGERSIEDMTIELLKGMLRNWLDAHLPSLVERLVREEIERVARRGR